MEDFHRSIAELMYPANWPFIWFAWAFIGFVGAVIANILTGLLIGYVEGPDQLTEPFGLGEIKWRIYFALVVPLTFGIMLSRYYVKVMIGDDIDALIGAFFSLLAVVLGFFPTFVFAELIEDYSGDWLSRIIGWIIRKFGW